MHRFSLADEMAEVRGEIARLRLREAQLRALILTAPDAALTGRWNRIEVQMQRHSALDWRLLPQALRDDPMLRCDRQVTTILCLPLPAGSLRPGWPIRREGVPTSSLH